VQDVSSGGVKVSGNPSGLKVGDALDIALVVQGEKVRYACEVKHVQTVKRSFGVSFQSGPKQGESDTKVKRCMQCRRDFSMDCKYCSQCGQRLATR